MSILDRGVHILKSENIYLDIHYQRRIQAHMRYSEWLEGHCSQRRMSDMLRNQSILRSQVYWDLRKNPVAQVKHSSGLKQERQLGGHSNHSSRNLL